MEDSIVLSTNLSLLDELSDAIIILDKEWSYRYVNKKVTQLTRKNKQELLGKSIWKLFPQAVKTPFYEKCVAVSKSRKAEKVVYYSPLKAWLEAKIYPVQDGVAVIFADVTRQKKYENQIIEQSQLVENAHDAIIIQDEKGGILYWNKGAEKLYGWKKEEVLGKHMSHLLQTGFPQERMEIFRKVREKGYWDGR